MRRPARGTAARAAFGMVAVTVALAGCGAEPPPSTVPSATLSPLPTAVTTTYAIGATAWYAGLVLHLESATAVLDPGGGPVDLVLRIDNPGEDLVSLAAPILLAAGGRAVEPVRGTVLPDVPPSGSVVTGLRFDVDGSFEMDKAAIRIGRTSEHQVIVPISDGSQERVTLEPVTFELAGEGRAGSIQVTVHSVELRADLPDWGLELSRTSMALTVSYDAMFTGTFTGGFAFTTANVGLELPDGRVLAAREDGHSAPALVIGPGATASGLRSRFEVPSPGIGLYHLIVRDGEATKRIELTVAGA